jgi:hypothetical protein
MLNEKDGSRLGNLLEELKAILYGYKEPLLQKLNPNQIRIAESFNPNQTLQATQPYTEQELNTY